MRHEPGAGRHPGHRIGVKRQALVLIVARLSAGVATAVLFVLFARAVTPQMFGAVSVVLSIVTFAVLFASFGVAQLVLQGAARNDDELVADGLNLNRVSSAALSIVGLVGLVASVPVAIAGDESLPLVTSILLLALVLEKNADVRMSILVAEGRRLGPGLNLVLRRATALAIFAVLPVVGADSAPAIHFAAAFLVGSAASAVHARVVAPLPSLQPLTATRLAAAVRAALPFLSNNLTTQGRTLDVVVLAAVAGVASSGYYAAAQRVASPIMVAISGLATALVPHSARLSGNRVWPLALRLTILHVCSALLLGGFLLLFQDLVGGLLGPEYDEAGDLLPLCVTATHFVALSTTLTSIGQARGMEQQLSRLGVVFLALLLVAVAAGSVLFGGAGCALALLLVYLIKCCVGLWLLRGES